MEWCHFLVHKEPVHVAFWLVMVVCPPGERIDDCGPPPGSRAEGERWAEFFSKSAVEQATRTIQNIHRRFRVEVVIDTFPSIPENMKAQFKPEEKNQFFRRWADTRAADEGVKGIYVLICKNPGHLQIEPDQSVRRRAFTSAERDALVKSALKLMGQKQFDAALLEIVNTIESTVATNLGSVRGGALRPRKDPRQGRWVGGCNRRAWWAGSVWV